MAAPSHTYSTPGTYTVTLTVSDASGCSASTSQVITVAGATGINNSTNNGGIQIWSSENRIYVDFTALQKVNAVVKIYDIIGREVSIGEVTSNNIYVKEIDNIEAADYLVSVRNNDGVITKKVFISNIK